MEIAVVRMWKTDAGITGTFSIDGQQRYFSLELPETFEGQPNVPNKTCIPAGTYPVMRLWSGHFDRMMPHITEVPGRTEIEIHVANLPKDILGCMGIGRLRISETEIGKSQEAFDEFNLEFDNAISAGEAVNITITG
jgi:hypothetical protein